MADKKVYRYPYTLIAETTDYLQIDVVEYESIAQLSGGSLTNVAGSRRNQGKNKKKTILLPIPSNISDTNAARYGSSELNSIAGAAIGGIVGIMEGGASFKGFDEGNQAIADGFKTAASDTAGAAGGIAGLQGFLTRQAASAAAGMLGANITPDQLLARTTGEILNPNMELLFNGPTLRSFRFSFKMTPRNSTEAREIKQIINCFKQSMAPKVGSSNSEINAAGGTNTFLRTPNVFELTYRQGSGEHKFLNKFKQCFLESVSVNYTADGTYATYDDGTPVSMIMDLSFKEIEPVYDVDYKETKYDGVGY